MRYFIRFTGHIIQQPGLMLPSEVYYDIISDFEKEDMEPTEEGKLGLKQFINAVMFQLMNHGMTVPKYPDRTQDGSKVTYDQRMGVLPHMIAFIDVTVKPIAMPNPILPELSMFDTEEVNLFKKEQVN